MPRDAEGKPMSGRGYLYKLVGFWAGFLILHYAYEFFPILPFKLFSGIDESYFQHAKVAFFAYLVVTLVEYLLRRRRPAGEGGIESLEGFAFARLFSLTILPWFIFFTWFAAAAFYGRLPTVFLEILYSNISLLLAGTFVLVMENSMEDMAYSKGFKAVILSLFVLSVLYYVIFTFRLPWADFFADPYAASVLSTAV
jgi:hypothetical protein